MSISFVGLICKICLRHRAIPHKGQPKVVKDQFFAVITHMSIFFGIPVGQWLTRAKKVATQRIKKDANIIPSLYFAKKVLIQSSRGGSPQND